MQKVYIYDELAHHNPHSGMGLYTSEIVKHLSSSKKISFKTFQKPKTNFGNNFFGKLLTVIHEMTFLQFKGVVKLVEAGTDAVYIPNPPAPFFLAKPVVLTIPDMAFYFDEAVSWPTRMYLFIVYFLSAKKAKYITTFSENSKRDIVKLLRVSESKVIIATPALKDSFIKLIGKPADKALLKKYGIKGKFILAVPGTYVKRKNMLDVLFALENLPTSISKELKIVSVGRVGDAHHNEFVESVKEKGLQEYFVFLNKIPDEDLVTLYKSAEIFVFPSLYEGFGLPPLEAMATGTPTIVYNNSSLPEVVGDGAIVVRNKNVMVKEIVKLFKDKKYNSLWSKKGMMRYKEFSFKKSAAQIAALFDTN